MSSKRARNLRWRKTMRIACAVWRSPSAVKNTRFFRRSFPSRTRRTHPICSRRVSILDTVVRQRSRRRVISSWDIPARSPLVRGSPRSRQSAACRTRQRRSKRAAVAFHLSEHAMPERDGTEVEPLRLEHDGVHGPRTSTRRATRRPRRGAPPAAVLFSMVGKPTIKITVRRRVANTPRPARARSVERDVQRISTAGRA